MDLTVSVGTGNDLNQAERERDRQVLRGPAMTGLTGISVKTPTPATQQDITLCKPGTSY